jgi:hypothetical protein
MVDLPVSFNEFRWLQELTAKTQPKDIPEVVGAVLLARGFVERKNGGFAITRRGHIALAKLG